MQMKCSQFPQGLRTLITRGYVVNCTEASISQGVLARRAAAMCEAHSSRSLFTHMNVFRLHVLSSRFYLGPQSHQVSPWERHCDLLTLPFEGLTVASNLRFLSVTYTGFCCLGVTLRKLVLSLIWRRMRIGHPASFFTFFQLWMLFLEASET